MINPPTSFYGHVYQGGNRPGKPGKSGNYVFGQGIHFFVLNIMHFCLFFGQISGICVQIFQIIFLVFAICLDSQTSSVYPTLKFYKKCPDI